MFLLKIQRISADTLAKRYAIDTRMTLLPFCKFYNQPVLLRRMSNTTILIFFVKPLLKKNVSSDNSMLYKIRPILDII